jgi:hypothetical protein
VCPTGECTLREAFYKDAPKEPKDEEMVTVYYAEPNDKDKCASPCRCVVIAKHITIYDDAGRKVIKEEIYESQALNLKTQKMKHPKKKNEKDKDFWEI